MMDDNDFRELLEYLQRPWQGYRKVRKGVIKRLRRHMTALGCTTLGCYLAVLGQDRSAYQMCQAHLRVTISLSSVPMKNCPTCLFLSSVTLPAP